MSGNTDDIRCTIEGLISAAEGTRIIDIRREEDYERETYPGALHSYWEDFDESLLIKDGKNILICYDGHHSDEIAEEPTFIPLSAESYCLCRSTGLL